MCVYKYIYKIKPTVPAAALLAMWNGIQIEATLFNISSALGCKRINYINVLRRHPPNSAVSSVVLQQINDLRIEINLSVRFGQFYNLEADPAGKPCINAAVWGRWMLAQCQI